MQPDEITRKAIGKHVQEIALKLNVNDSWIYRICGGPEHDPYTKFDTLLAAAQEVNPPGAELLISDAVARYEARKSGEILKGADWNTLLAETITSTSDALAEAVTKGANTEAKINLAIRALKQLLVQHKVER